MPEVPTATQYVREIQATEKSAPREPSAAVNVTCFADDAFHDAGLPVKISGFWWLPSKPTATPAVAEKHLTEVSAPYV